MKNKKNDFAQQLRVVWDYIRGFTSKAADFLKPKIKALGNSIAQYIKDVFESINKFLHRKKNGKKIKQSVLRRMFLNIVLMTLLYFGFYIATQNGMFPIVTELYLELFGGSDFYLFMYENEELIVILIYIISLIFIINRALNRLAGYFDSISGALNDMEEGRNIRDMPSDLRDFQVRITGLQYSIRSSEQAAREAEQRKNDLVVYLAHDLKTPLTSVIGYLTLLDESPELDVKHRAKYIGITLDKAMRLEQLINEFFDITRFNLQSITLDFNRVNVTRMLYQIADEFYPVFEEKNLKCSMKIEQKTEIIGDADKLARVFDNLLRNAVSYSYSGTEIVISAWRAAGSVWVTVRNTGDYIPQEKLERIFDKFFRVDSARSSSSGGSGLGLAIAKQIVELHGGSISAESDEQFTQFTVSLPVDSRKIVRKS